MQHVAEGKDPRSMEEALVAIRQVFSEANADFADQDGDEQTIGRTEARPADEDATTSRTGLLSREATSAISSSVSRLTQNVKKHEPTLEEVVRDMLRPMLKSWLDENLPAVVEQIVEEEIKRAIRGR
jgi:cell pole-organizing protein PopZ